MLILKGVDNIQWYGDCVTKDACGNKKGNFYETYLCVSVI
jgi:hypothetical protein